jgi:hypothetical protein
LDSKFQFRAEIRFGLRLFDGHRRRRVTIRRTFLPFTPVILVDRAEPPPNGGGTQTNII